MHLYESQIRFTIADAVHVFSFFCFISMAILWCPAEVLYIVNALAGGPANATRQKYTN